MDNEASPLPWRYDRDEIRDANDRHVCCVNNSLANSQICIDTARQVVQAVNAFPELTARVKVLEEAMEGVFDGLIAVVGEHSMSLSEDVLLAIREKVSLPIQAALEAKAGE